MIFKILANLVFIIHFLFIVYVTLGGLLTYWWRRNLWLHLPCIAYGFMIEVFAWTCPLTPLENWLNQQAGQEPYYTGFIEQYLGPLIYPVEYTSRLQVMLAVGVIAINLVIYFSLLKRRLYKR